MEKIKQVNTIEKSKELEKEIIAMVKADQKMRESEEWDSEIDKQNTERMKELVMQYGWPVKSLVGKEASHGAWLLVQHADHDINFQTEVLGLLEDTIGEDEIEKADIAYLTDRVRVNSGQRQVFGTQFFENEKGELIPRPIENIEQLEERRKEFGLSAFSEYEKLMQKIDKNNELGIKYGKK